MLGISGQGSASLLVSLSPDWTALIISFNILMTIFHCLDHFPCTSLNLLALFLEYRGWKYALSSPGSEHGVRRRYGCGFYHPWMFWLAPSPLQVSVSRVLFQTYLCCSGLFPASHPALWLQVCHLSTDLWKHPSSPDLPWQVQMADLFFTSPFVCLVEHPTHKFKRESLIPYPLPNLFLPLSHISYNFQLKPKVSLK